MGTATVEVGSEGVENFMFLCDGDWNNAVIPTVANATPDVSYSLASNVSMAASLGHYFAIGLAEKEQGSAGIPYEVSLTIGTHGQLTGVSWRPSAPLPAIVNERSADVQE